MRKKILKNDLINFKNDYFNKIHYLTTKEHQINHAYIHQQNKYFTHFFFFNT